MSVYHPPKLLSPRNVIDPERPILSALTVLDPVSALTSVTKNSVVKNATACTITDVTNNGLQFQRQIQTDGTKFSNINITMYLDITSIPTPVGASKCGFFMYVFSGLVGVSTNKWTGIAILKDSSGNYHRRTVSSGVAASTGAYVAGEVPAILSWDTTLQASSIFRGGCFDSWEADFTPLTVSGNGAYLPFVSGFTSLGVGLAIIDENGEAGTYEGQFSYAVIKKADFIPDGL